MYGWSGLLSIHCLTYFQRLLIRDTFKHHIFYWNEAIPFYYVMIKISLLHSLGCKLRDPVNFWSVLNVFMKLHTDFVLTRQCDMNKKQLLLFKFLAHLSRRIIWWAYRIGRPPSSIVRCMSSSTLFNHLLHRNHWASQIFSIDIPVSKQWRPWSDAGFCGIWSGFALFAYVPKMGR